MLKIKKRNLILSAILCFIILSASFSIPAVRAPILGTLSFPLGLLNYVKQEFMGLAFYHRNYAQNERLRNEIDFLRNKLNSDKEILLESARLKDLLSFKENSPFKLIAARVIGRSPDSWSSGIIIDKGRRSGIRRGMAVINNLGIVGRVTETQENISKILLISDPGTGVSAVVSRSRQEGLVSGTLGTSLIMKYLPEDSDIIIGDDVISSGLNLSYPKGLLIGKVVSIGHEFSGLSRYAIVKPAVKLSNIEEVLIVAQ